MQLDELIEKYGVEEISKKTFISIDDLLKLKDGNFKDFHHAKLSGIFKILNREYGMDISNLKKYHDNSKIEKKNETISKYSYIETFYKFEPIDELILILLSSLFFFLLTFLKAKQTYNSINCIDTALLGFLNLFSMIISITMIIGYVYTILKRVTFIKIFILIISLLFNSYSAHFLAIYIVYPVNPFPNIHKIAFFQKHTSIHPYKYKIKSNDIKNLLKIIKEFNNLYENIPDEQEYGNEKYNKEINNKIDELVQQAKIIELDKVTNKDIYKIVYILQNKHLPTAFHSYFFPNKRYCAMTIRYLYTHTKMLS